jgi:SAM-dependent methyltransferase
MEDAACRFCAHPLSHTVVDLGMSPLCESYVPPAGLNSMEPFYPLRVLICEKCLLVQLDEYVGPDAIFTEYAYFSSYASSWVEHARKYVDGIVDRLALTSASRVVEVACNDGYLLQHFLPYGIRPVGIEPALNVAKVANQKGIETVGEFFGKGVAGRLRSEGLAADLIVANNVLAHVPDINDFVGGFKALLAPGGVVTIEFPHLYRLIEGNQFDTIYHEHFSYLSFHTTCRILAAHGLRVFDVEELTTHGGSLRVYAAHAESAEPAASPRVAALHDLERTAGVTTLDYYSRFAEQVRQTKRELLKTLIAIKEAGHSIAGYGAPGKGNTLLNYCGIREDFLDYTVDRNPYKQGKFLPGTHIPIFEPSKIGETRPDYILILPWNFAEEIVAQLEYVQEWGAQFIIPVPQVAIVPAGRSEMALSGRL